MLQALLKKYTKSSETPELDLVLRRAAAFGTMHEIEILINAGANIHSLGSQSGSTALHQAILHGKIENIRTLILHGASVNVPDKNNMTGMNLAEKQADKKILEVISAAENARIFNQDTLIKLILMQLPLRDLFRQSALSKEWQKAVKETLEMHLLPAGLTPEQMKQFFSLPQIYQYLVLGQFLVKKDKDAIHSLFMILNMPQVNRWAVLIPSILSMNNCTDIMCIVIILRIIPERIIDRFLMRDQYHPYFPRDNNIDTKNDLLYTALIFAEGLIKQSDEVLNTPVIFSLLNRHGYTALREKLFSLSDVKLFRPHYFPGMRPEDLIATLLSEQGVNALRNKLITPEQAAAFKEDRSLKSILSPAGLNALKEGLITCEQASGFYHSGSISGPHNNLNLLLSPNGILLLRAKVLTPEQACVMPELESMLRLNPIHLIRALQDKIVIINDFKYGGRFSFWRKEESPIEIIGKYYALATSAPEYKKACITIQSFWRAKVAREQLSILKEIKQKMGTQNIHQLQNLAEAKQLVDHSKVKEARKKLSLL